MAKFRKMYAKKRRTYKKKRGFKKRRSNKMMSNRTAWTNQTWTQSFPLIQNAANAANSTVVYLVDCLGTSNPAPPNVFYVSPPGVQTNAQGLFTQQLFSTFTIKGVAVKLIFPEAPPNTPINWCMAFDSDNFVPGANILTAPSLVQAIQGSQTGPVPTNRVISRYFNMAKEKKRLGISFSDIANYTYFNQLTANRPYVYGWVNMLGAVAPG